ncbi:uncharacterized protein BCR38DRAFT_368143 [Pseudomassariella vexata]|uniref:CCCH zinc finger and RRM domain-containing protein n=1 Tax=Pseudomassariella vexata TaxID=1141098 RepID=A0A1Y2E0X1_9PEZI|nr:uncharacterized protein BCR38DRAFT_368143 [Pseudomassariella vexata]ORY65129.1 hypothetical protein BCR38DRAFT_368143 [Pseudomassariella vexata]
MLFAENDAPLLKAWIVQRLANTSDADADVLADYVLALLRHDGDVDSIRKLFEEEIPDFLREDSAAFTNDVFQAVQYRSYVPGAPPPPPIPRQAPAPPSAPQALQSQHVPQGPASQLQYQPPQPPPMFPDSHHTPYVDTRGPFSNQPFRNGSKKRSYRDLDAPDPLTPAWSPYNPSLYQQDDTDLPPYKQARRGGIFTPRGGRFDDAYGARGRGGPNGYLVNEFPGVPHSTGPPGYSPHQPFQTSSSQGMPPIDANSILENIRQLQELGAQMGIQMPQTGPLPTPVYSGPASTPHTQRRRGRCRDYETKGFCSRGNKCLYKHGTGPAYPAKAPGDEYDPNDASMSITLEHPGQPVKPVDMPLLQMPPQMPPFNRREPKKSKRKGSRAPFSAEGPVHDKTKTQIVVESIPEENFNENAIREFFTQFGTIENVSLRPSHPKRIAIVKFDSWASANAAWKSPKVVFDNRFVKVYWYKDESPVASNAKLANGAKSDSANGQAGKLASTEPEFDMEEFKRKQEEAQRIHEEKTQKREAIERERQALEEKKRALAARQQEEKRKLQAKLAARGVREASLSPILSRPSNDGAKPSQAETLRAKLAELEAEANSLGLDADAVQEEASSWAPRGRGRGRRPFYRGRGSFPPRASRGGYGYRGRGGAGVDVHAAYAAYSLDNRPKIIALTGVDFTDPSKDEALRHYLFGIGEFAAIHTDPTTTHITFKDRKTAEQFMFGASANKTIPGVEGMLELTWTMSAPKTAGADSDLPVASGIDEEQSKAPNVDADENASFSAVADIGDAGDQGDMDYEGGEWDIS